MADFARGEQLVLLRERRHLSQEEAAHQIGVSAKSLRGWEHGKAIRWENAKRVARFYKVKAEELVSREVAVVSDLDLRADQIDRIEEKLDEILRILKDEPGEVDAPIPEQPPPLPEPAPTPSTPDEHGIEEEGKRRPA